VPGNVERIPRFGARIDTAPLPAPAVARPNPPGGGGSPLVGGTIDRRHVPDCQIERHRCV